MTDVTTGSGALARGSVIAAGAKQRSFGFGFDWTMLVWLVFAAILIVIVVNPIFRLVWESIAAEDGSLTLDNYVKAYGAPALLAVADQHALHGRRHGLAGRFAGGAAGLGVRAHGHAGARFRAALRAGRLHHSALSGSRRLGAARRPQLRLAQQGLDVDDRRADRPLQHLQPHRPHHHHGAASLLLHLRVHVVGAGTRLLGDGGRRQRARRRPDEDCVPDHPAADPAGHPRRPHHHLPAVDRAVRRAGDHRHPRALSGGDHAA